MYYGTVPPRVQVSIFSHAAGLGNEQLCEASELAFTDHIVDNAKPIASKNDSVGRSNFVFIDNLFG